MEAKLFLTHSDNFWKILQQRTENEGLIKNNELHGLSCLSRQLVSPASIRAEHIVILVE